MEDIDFIERIKAGHRGAYNDLIDIYAPRVINTCYKFLLNREDARDISQEVFVEVFQSIGSFRGESKLSTWIYRIAVTRSLDEIKKRSRKKRFSSISKMMHIDELADWLGGGLMPDRHIIEKESMEEMMKALDTLPSSQRVAFTLSKIDGYSNPEIAEIMNTTTLAVESLVYRAKKRLSGELEKLFKKKER